jgi:hypothetical protein
MKFFRHENCPKVDDDQILTNGELMAALGRHDMPSVRHSLRSMTGTGDTAGWTLNALWPLIVKVNMDENPYFPYQLDTRLYNELPPKMSESLICLLSGQLAERETSPVILATHTANFSTIGQSLRARLRQMSGMLTFLKSTASMTCTSTRIKCGTF